MARVLSMSVEPVIARSAKASRQRGYEMYAHRRERRYGNPNCRPSGTVVHMAMGLYFQRVYRRIVRMRLGVVEPYIV